MMQTIIGVDGSAQGWEAVPQAATIVEMFKLARKALRSRR
jgi:hypothetical protein